MLGGLYSTGALVSRGVRDKDDSLNFGVGGALAGAFLGLRSGSPHQVVLKAITVGCAGVACAFLANQVSQASLRDLSSLLTPTPTTTLSLRDHSTVLSLTLTLSVPLVASSRKTLAQPTMT